MTQTTVSVVIVSRGRPKALRRCLLGVSHLFYDAFEIVVVADPPGIAVASKSEFAQHLKLVAFDEPNISAARNEGIAAAAGDVVAFIDDDAVPEPTWLDHLIEPSMLPNVGAMTGYVRGRNGISFQHRASQTGVDGFDRSLELTDDSPQVFEPPAVGGIKTQGTNMAFPREILVELGGFDEAFKFFLDETDLNLRLAKAGYQTAIVPLAQVHHGYYASDIRRQDRVPTDLFEIAASRAVFQQKHLDSSLHTENRIAVRSVERKRLLRHMVAGGLGPEDVSKLMKRFDIGFQAGLERKSQRRALPANPSIPFQKFPSDRRQGRLIAGSILKRRSLRKRASKLVSEGNNVTLFLFSRTTLFHRHYFTDAGYWEQRGGIFGKSVRNQPIFLPYSFASRVQKEKERLASFRDLNV